jgi:hypothetical protein
MKIAQKKKEGLPDPQEALRSSVEGEKEVLSQ